jgi:aminoglycoside 3-N-acetyltransferase
MISAHDIAESLRGLGVRRDDTLFVHAGLRGALRLAGDSPAAKVDTAITGLREAVADGLLVMPTFTYSFCRGEEYDPVRTPSAVGTLSERFRLLPGARRTTDPIFSAVLLGPLPESWEHLFEVRDTDCFGERSVFAMLRERRSKILFFGVDFGYATFVHHVEQRLGVPYRYMKDFHGAVVQGGQRAPVTARYFVRDLGGDVEVYLDALGHELLASGGARTATLPEGPALLMTDTVAIEEAIVRKLRDNPSFLLRRGHPEVEAVGA